ncbi:MAG TPA: DUF4304 domain-containing protein [Gemmataceae bacterium]|nr:DUF4304 domain-containing protein [Gemmataceae bacterium]
MEIDAGVESGISGRLKVTHEDLVVSVRRRKRLSAVSFKFASRAFMSIQSLELTGHANDDIARIRVTSRVSWLLSWLFGGFRFLLGMSATQNMMKVVVAAFAPTLKAAGYRKQGARFREEVSPTVVRLVNIQSSPWNMGSEGHFCVNLGVYHRDLAALHDACPVVESPLVQHCIVQHRLGFLMPVGKDYWWSINDKTDLAALGSKVALTWEKYGKPWLDSNSTLEGAREFLLIRNWHFLAAMASLAMGKPDDAHYWLDKSNELWPEGRERIETWRANHLLQLPKSIRRTKE